MKIVIIDDDNLVSLSLNTILSAQDDIEVSAVGDSGQQAVKLYEEHMPDVMLMDIRMQGMTGLEAAEKILGKYPDAKILLLTTFSDDEYIVKAISLGAKGYILKQAFESIAPALRAVNNGQTVFGTQIMDRIPHLFGADGEASSGTGQARFIDAMKSYDISVTNIMKPSSAFIRMVPPIAATRSFIFFMPIPSPVSPESLLSSAVVPLSIISSW